MLDAERFAEVLAEELPGLGIEASRLQYVRYKPGVSCLAVHRLTTARGRLELYAKTFIEDDGPKLAKARLAKQRNNGTGLTLVPKVGRLVVRTFPADAKLPRLAQLAFPERVRHLVDRVTAKARATGVSVDTGRESRLTRLAYKPERRFVARLGDDLAVLKFYRPAAFRRAYRSARAIESGERFCVPRWIGRSRRHGVLAFEWNEGRSLRVALEESASPAGVALAGAALAELHRQSPERLVARPPTAELATVRRMAEQLGFLLPAMAERALRLCDRLRSSLAVEPASWTTVHGDFYDKQILLADDRVVFLDFDEAAVGDPLADIGNFVAHLEVRALIGALPESTVTESAAALLDGYRGAGGRVAHGWRARVASGLLKLAHHPFRSGRPDWAVHSARLLEKAREWSDCRPSRRPTNRSGRLAGSVVCLNQDAGIAPDRAKGAAVHLCAMRDAFESLGASVAAIDEPDDASALERLECAERKRPVALVYERYALGKSVGADFAAETGVPHVLEVNAPLANEASRWRGFEETEGDRLRERRVFSRAALVVAVSNPVAEYAVTRGARPERVQVWPNGVDARRFVPRSSDDALRRELVPGVKFVVGFHGRLRPWHGFELLVEAVAELAADQEPVHLLVVGEGDFEASLEGRLDRRHWTAVGWQPHDQIPRYVAVFDALPLTYSANQPFYFSPLKMAEAMACGVVPVVPRLDALAEQVCEGREALVYAPGDVGELTAALRRLIDAPELRASLAHGARARALGMSWERIARNVMEVAS